MIQSVLSAIAVYFVVWWITLFAILPIGLRTQAEDDNVTLGTIESAPSKVHGWRIVLLTTLVSGIVYGSWFLATAYFGFSFDSMPAIVPRYGG